MNVLRQEERSKDVLQSLRTSRILCCSFRVSLASHNIPFSLEAYGGGLHSSRIIGLGMPSNFVKRDTYIAGLYSKFRAKHTP